MENIYNLELLAKQRQQEILDNFGVCNQNNDLELLEQGRRSLFNNSQSRIKNLGSAIKSSFNVKSGVRNEMA